MFVLSRLAMLYYIKMLRTCLKELNYVLFIFDLF